MHFFKINELLNRRFGNVNNIFLLVLLFLSVYEKKNPTGVYENNKDINQQRLLPNLADIKSISLF